MKVERDRTIDQISDICGFFRNEDELLYTFPHASYPLTCNQVEIFLRDRSELTVLSGEDGEIMAFASLYDIHKDNYCFLGNLIINPRFRRMGLAGTLLSEMILLAVEKYGVREMKLNCWNENTNGMSFYFKAGFSPIRTFYRMIQNREVEVKELSRPVP